MSVRLSIKLNKIAKKRKKKRKICLKNSKETSRRERSPFTVI